MTSRELRLAKRARLRAVVRCLRRGGLVRGWQLAEAAGVDLRSAYRYVHQLRSEGWPIRARPGSAT